MNRPSPDDMNDIIMAEQRAKIKELDKENKRLKDDNKLLIETNERLKERNRELFDENKELKAKNRALELRLEKALVYNI